MLSIERKKQMVESLKKDYIVLTEIFLEVAADARADIAMLELEKVIEDASRERLEIRYLEDEYMSFVHTDPVKAVDTIERLYEIAEKYDSLRMDKL
ncbi:hypothetical protein [Aggregatibacter actinomycetemcomitans]|uniref:hypothetical protein n=2 Tax=Aggregatibacter actinomycetemcomitans TaxID=714 RepID=UPI0002434805|nr:hypothetical protein [Aggregatibacter actinomycetemcomitans]AEW76130.1 hypothetical protein ANH9381_0086 [Aggregatibacter actinomycetemcomitans ANH9381]KOE51993.1 hypothetical protein S23A_0209090 [Aggregatibacter actinomycetemcomitans serotype b str. S23A]KOE54880.1 hypothetical protein I23C_0303160 [Aggregatibacter actinomycetemcomitans serotype b str. I23C]KYK75304.1 hypothetical protein SA3096_03210 [Aggregatibacter actinomycetemcomitans serotype e str. SA3096]KYK77478.1 hypothetical pr